MAPLETYRSRDILEITPIRPTVLLVGIASSKALPGFPLSNMIARPDCCFFDEVCVFLAEINDFIDEMHFVGVFLLPCQ